MGFDIAVEYIGSDETIYVGSNDRKVYAINADGKKKWEFAMGGKVQSSPAIGSDGTVYVGSFDQKVYAIKADGTKTWEFAPDELFYSSPPSVRTVRSTSVVAKDSSRSSPMARRSGSS